VVRTNTYSFNPDRVKSADDPTHVAEGLKSPKAIADDSVTLPGDCHVCSMQTDLMIGTATVPDDPSLLAGITQMNITPALGVFYMDLSVLNLTTVLQKLQDTPTITQ
jgi:hypothetical protein